MHVLIVSPHFDDAPLSLGQSMLDGDLAPHRVSVGIVFSRTNWVRWWYPTRKRAPIVGAVRRAEEVHASFRFHYRVRTGGLEEVILRTGSSDPAGFINPGVESAADPYLDDVMAVLRPWAAGADLVLVPLGVGDHVDHRLVAVAAERLAAEGVRVGWYEDRPYVSFSEDGAVATRVDALGVTLEPRPFSGPIGTTKLRRIGYPSQISDHFRKAMTIDVDEARREIVWLPPDDPWPAG